MNAFVIGKLRYMLPIYMNTTSDNITKLHRVLMRCARTTIGNYCCRMNTAAILGKCNWLGINKFIVHSGLVTINKIIKNKNPLVITNLYNNINNQRNCKKISTKYLPKTQKFQKFYLNGILKYYNQIPDIIKEVSLNQFKIKSKMWIDKNYNGINDSHD